MGTRPVIFKWRQTEPGIIHCAVRWYLRYSLLLRDIEELLEERGLNVDHTTVWRWVQDYGPELELCLAKTSYPLRVYDLVKSSIRTVPIRFLP
jgi:transposase-like protein